MLAAHNENKLSICWLTKWGTNKHTKRKHTNNIKVKLSIFYASMLSCYQAIMSSCDQEQIESVLDRMMTWHNPVFILMFIVSSCQDIETIAMYKWSGHERRPRSALRGWLISLWQMISCCLNHCWRLIGNSRCHRLCWLVIRAMTAKSVAGWLLLLWKIQRLLRVGSIEKVLVWFPFPVGPEMDNPTGFRRQFLFRIS